MLAIGIVCIELISRCSSRAVDYMHQPQTPGEDRILPPAFPFWGPFGWFSSGILCPFIAGPYPGMKGRACLGPAPPFRKPPVSSTLAPPTNPPGPNLPPSTSSPLKDGDEDNAEEDEEEIVEYKPLKTKCNCMYHT